MKMMKQLDHFLRELKIRRKGAEEEIDQEHKRVSVTVKADDVVDVVINETKDHLVALSGLYDSAIDIARKQEQMEEIKKHVKETLATLEGKAATEREMML